MKAAIEQWAREMARMNGQLDTSRPPTVRYQESAQVNVTVTDHHGKSVTLTGNLHEIIKEYR